VARAKAAGVNFRAVAGPVLVIAGGGFADQMIEHLTGCLLCLDRGRSAPKLLPRGMNVSAWREGVW
jgi:hypothetical protein